jgi:hypothetical protein
LIAVMTGAFEPTARGSALAKNPNRLMAERIIDVSFMA